MNLIEQVLYSNELAIAQMAEFERELRDLEAARQTFGARTLEQMDGKKHNYEVPVEIEIPTGTSLARIRGTFTHNLSGMFVCEYMWGAYRETTQARWRPCSSIWDNQQSPAIVNALDFEFEIGEDQGFNWQNEPMPSPLLGGIERPYYMPVSAQITGNQLISVFITPTRSRPEAGTLLVVFGGYQTLDPPPEGQQ